MKPKVRIIEVGLRDGLQNEKNPVPMALRLDCAEALLRAGVQNLEVGAFVRFDRVPQMEGTAEILTSLLKKYPQDAGRFSVLVPNEKGYDQAEISGAKEIAIFASVSEGFSQHNINCSIEESFQRFEPVVKRAKKRKIKIRGYLSVCFGCPYDGNVDPKKVIQLTKRLLKMGCYEVSLGDTIGAANPNQVRQLLQRMKKNGVSMKKIAGHFHDTRGTALSNIYASLLEGVRSFDSSLGGLGGCPYALGSSGNVATEDVVQFVSQMNFETGIDLKNLVEASNKFVRLFTGRPPDSKMSSLSSRRCDIQNQ